MSEFQPVLVAPRPVRVVTVTHNRSVSRNAITSNENHSGSDTSISPCPSPRPTTLPSEALEEFLSILRPSFFPPSSPILRRRPLYSLNSTTSPVSFAAAKRSLTQSHSPILDSSYDIASAYAPIHLSHSADTESRDDFENELPVRWYASTALSSPISRTNTRNPFQRHPSYEIPSFSSSSPSPLSSSVFVSSSPTRNLSPAKIPLPLPTPDEIFAFAAAPNAPVPTVAAPSV